MVRAEGFTSTPRKANSGDHLCWGYDDDRQHARDVAEFLAAGMHNGERVQYLTDGSNAEVVDLLVAGGHDGELLLGPITGGYVVTDPLDQVSVYAALTQSALDDGYSGYRVAADATPLVLGESQRRAFARYELHIDRFMSAHPMAAMCCYDQRVLAPDALAQLACVHPATNVKETRFHLAGGRGGSLELVGEIDLANLPEFVDALAHVRGLPLELDGSGIRYIDHRGLLALDELGGVTLRTSFAAAARVAELLDLQGLRVVPS